MNTLIKKAEEMQAWVKFLNERLEADEDLTEGHILGLVNDLTSLLAAVEECSNETK